ncbi:hypothetical protein [Halomonas caseinilytica]|uniref:Uncharacterized protein n=1 Tax=Halomonas caseinilytica TaxID=438744 RepID=A0A1M7AC70_9GAMM|nr:hypothetical protein [Halomonas caseinilytica]SEN57842.1 hypothetical protein SAMN04487952_12023 [Halomonas caseinilytica]SHL40272.1 hypothetical protein SAMN05192556_11317 [Halomonas caseinilytica]
MFELTLLLVLLPLYVACLSLAWKLSHHQRVFKTLIFGSLMFLGLISYLFLALGILLQVGFSTSGL